jgi:hypothetical protein
MRYTSILIYLLIALHNFHLSSDIWGYDDCPHPHEYPLWNFQVNNVSHDNSLNYHVANKPHFELLPSKSFKKSSSRFPNTTEVFVNDLTIHPITEIIQPSANNGCKLNVRQMHVKQLYFGYIYHILAFLFSRSSPQISRIPVHGSSSNTNLLDMIGRNGSGDSPSVGMSSSYGASNMIPTAIVSPTRSFASAASGDRSSPAPRIILDCSGEEMENHLDKLLECPVCFEVILPPIMSCVEGHSWCQSCHASLQRCPVCRGNFMGVRNLLVEQFLEKCRFKCKHHNVGCSTVLPGNYICESYRRSNVWMNMIELI